jgi:phenol 2-monooxygenase
VHVRPAIGTRLKLQICRAGSTFVTLYSGIGIRYTKSSIVSGERQDIAHKLVLGERMHPATVVRAADGWPHNVQDLLPSDARYRVLVFAGNITEDNQLSRVRELSKALDTPFWRKDSDAKKEDVLDILAFAHGVKSPVDAYTTIRAELGLDWTKCVLAGALLIMQPKHASGSS